MNKPYDQRQGDRSSHSSRRDDSPRVDWKQKFEKIWIEKQLDSNAIKFAEDFGKHLAHSLTTSQIRNYFGEVRRVQQKGILKEQTAFLLLKPKLAYAAKRAGSDAANDFKEVMEAAHNAVMEKQGDEKEFPIRFQNFVDFLEAILAYHKEAGGK